MRITKKGQVTIPAEIRKKLGLLPSTEVQIATDGNVVTIRKSDSLSRGRRIVERLSRARANGMTTDEIIALTRGRVIRAVDVYNPDGNVSGGSPLSHRGVRSSGCRARVWS
jgi:AbrB family looped-hinge helix DNA binding protein